MEEYYGRRVNYLSSIIKREFQKLPAVSNLNRVSDTNGRLLLYISRQENQPVFQKDIEAQFGITRSTASKVVSLMEKKNLVQRIPVDNDARLKQLILTEEAKAIVQDLDEQVLSFENRLVKGLSEEQKQLFLDIIERMEENIKEEELL